MKVPPGCTELPWELRPEAGAAGAAWAPEALAGPPLVVAKAATRSTAVTHRFTPTPVPHAHVHQVRREPNPRAAGMRTVGPGYPIHMQPIPETFEALEEFGP